MNPSEKNKLYNKYLAGDISGKEMHRLNELALDDDFLFDALEGASGFEKNNPMAIRELNSRLVVKSKSKRRPLYLWLSAAASLAILLFAINYFTPVSNEMLTNVLPEMEIASEKEEDTNISESADDFATMEQSTDLPEMEEDPALIANSTRAKNEGKGLSKEIAETKSRKEVAENDIEVARLRANESRPPVPPEARVVAPVEEAKTQNIEAIAIEDSKLALDKKEIEPTVAEASKKADQESAPSQQRTIIGKNSSNKTKNNSFSSTALANRPSISKDLMNEAEADLATGVGATVLSFEVEVLNDSLNSANLEAYLEDELLSVEQRGEFLVAFDLEDGDIISEVTIVQSIGQELDGQLISIIENFKGWIGSGKKRVNILVR